MVGSLVRGDAAMMPRATYRLQFHSGFRFEDAARLAPYLAELGVSHVYASPYLKARPGSTHGYDITDHLLLNPELGAEKDYRDMSAAFAAAGLGQILDFVPNHMGVGGADNPLWLDVLEWGPESDHAGWFDIDWDSDNRYLHDKLLVPFLGGQYGAELKLPVTVRARMIPLRGRFAPRVKQTHLMGSSSLSVHVGTFHSEKCIENTWQIWSSPLIFALNIFLRPGGMVDDMAPPRTSTGMWLYVPSGPRTYRSAAPDLTRSLSLFRVRAIGRWTL
jgi:(1->4)-alpha-D-glucan 1-alpha-D-glucosylmutase